MSDLEFHIYKVPSEAGDWLAVFEGKEMVFLGCSADGKKKLEQEISDFFELNYHFNVGKFTAVPWTKGNFWKTKHKIKLQGTEFQMKVWLELLKIPRGQTVSYTDLAKKIRKPTAFRAVASAVAKNPIAFYIPCHRVVSKTSGPQGRLKFRWGSKVKQILLASEGAI